MDRMSAFHCRLNRFQNMPLRTRRSSTRHAAHFRQHRLDGGPFKFAEFVTHDSRLRFGSLNYVHGGVINLEPHLAMPLML